MASDVAGVTTQSTLAEKIAAAKQLMDQMRECVVRHGDVVAFVVEQDGPEISLDVVRWYAADSVCGGKVDERLSSERVNDEERRAIVRALERVDGYGEAKPIPAQLVRLRPSDLRQIAVDRAFTRRWKESLALASAATSTHDGHDRAPRSSSSSRSTRATRDGPERPSSDEDDLDGLDVVADVVLEGVA